MKKKNFILTLVIFCLLFLCVFLTEGWSAATYTSATGNLDIPCVNVPNVGTFEANLHVAGVQLDLTPGLEFILQSAVLTTSICDSPATFDSGSGIAHIPVLAVPDTGVGMQYYDLKMLYVASSDPMRFSVTEVSSTQLGVVEPGPPGPQGDPGPPGVFNPDRVYTNKCSSFAGCDLCKCFCNDKNDIAVGGSFICQIGTVLLGAGIADNKLSNTANYFTLCYNPSRGKYEAPTFVEVFCLDVRDPIIIVPDE